MPIELGIQGKLSQGQIVIPGLLFPLIIKVLRRGNLEPPKPLLHVRTGKEILLPVLPPLTVRNGNGQIPVRRPQVAVNPDPDKEVTKPGVLQLSRVQGGQHPGRVIKREPAVAAQEKRRDCA